MSGARALRRVGGVVPTRFRIVVTGRLSEGFATAICDLELEASEGRTALTGTFVDQAQLHGVLQRLCDLGIELESVNAVD
jgi:hypothetical protein